MTRWFKRKKKPGPESRDEVDTVLDEDELDEDELDEDGVATEEQSATEDVPLHPKEEMIESFISRLNEILSEIADETKVVKTTSIQLIVGGMPILLSKERIEALSLSRERSVRADVFIRLSEEAAKALAETKSVEEFGQLYRKMVRARGTTSYVALKLQTDLDDLRGRGYFKVELLRALIDA
ncbi:MAG: hypothetical protein ACFFCO_13500 [Promethearchaeota archaeon]